MGDLVNDRVQMFDPIGNWLGAFPVTVATWDLDVDPGGVFVVIASNLTQLGSYSTAGAPIAAWQPTDPSILADIEGVAIGLDGRIYVPLKGFGRIEVFTSAGVYLNQIPVQSAAIDVDNDGNLYLYGASGEVFKLTAAGQVVWQFRSLGSASGNFAGLEDLVVDRDGNIFTVESGDRVQKFMSDTTPAIRVSWGAVKARYR